MRLLAAAALLVALLAGSAASSGINACQPDGSDDACSCLSYQVLCISEGFDAVPGGFPASTSDIFLQQNTIASLSSSSFAGLNNLTTLILNENSITSIGSGLFQGLAQLEQLDLSSNEITSVNWNAFSGLTQLSLNLGSNQLAGITPRPFDGVFLDVSSNNIASLPAGGFTGPASLAELDMESNDITTIPDNSFSGLGSLAVLALTDNPIASIQADAFSGLTSLVSLALGGSQLTEFPANIFLPLGQLQSLDVSSSKIESIAAGDFTGLTSLTFLQLSMNMLSSVDTGDFSDLTALNVLYVTDNSITQLGANAFQGLTKLTLVDISSNSIDMMDATAFQSATKLQSINLATNALTSVSKSDFSGLSHLTSLSLANNQLTCLDLSFVLWAKPLSVAVSGNPFAHAPAGMFGSASAPTYCSSTCTTCFASGSTKCCPAGCLSCLSSNQCSQCYTGYSWNGAACVVNTPVSLYSSPLNLCTVCSCYGGTYCNGLSATCANLDLSASSELYIDVAGGTVEFVNVTFAPNTVFELPTGGTVRIASKVSTLDADGFEFAGNGQIDVEFSGSSLLANLILPSAPFGLGSVTFGSISISNNADLKDVQGFILPFTHDQSTAVSVDVSGNPVLKSLSANFLFGANISASATSFTNNPSLDLTAGFFYYAPNGITVSGLAPGSASLDSATEPCDASCPTSCVGGVCCDASCATCSVANSATSCTSCAITDMLVDGSCVFAAPFFDGDYESNYAVASAYAAGHASSVSSCFLTSSAGEVVSGIALDGKICCLRPGKIHSTGDCYTGCGNVETDYSYLAGANTSGNRCFARCYILP